MHDEEYIPIFCVENARGSLLGIAMGVNFPVMISSSNIWLHLVTNSTLFPSYHSEAKILLHVPGDVKFLTVGLSYNMTGILVTRED